MKEIDIQHRIQLATAGPLVRLFRNNNGEAWLGRSFTVRDGRLVAGAAQRVRYGLAPGSADLIGFRSLIVTPDMVGRCIARFAAIEVKSESGRPTKEQEAFLLAIASLGGLAGIARSEAEAAAILHGS